jgi:hypothetical protein
MQAWLPTCYDKFSLTRSQPWFLLNPSVDMEALFPRPKSSGIALCERCQRIPLPKLPDPLWVYSHHHQHLPNACELAAFAETCSLCALFLTVLVEAIQKAAPQLSNSPLPELLHPEPLLLKCEMEFASRSSKPIGPLLTGLEIVPPFTTPALSIDIPYRSLVLDLFADEGNFLAPLLLLN